MGLRAPRARRRARARGRTRAEAPRRASSCAGSRSPQPRSTSQTASKTARHSTPARTMPVARSSASFVTSCQARTPSATGPTANVRVMSAKQDDASSRGQRSNTTGSPNRIGPWPISCPAAPCGPGATTNSSAEQPCVGEHLPHRRLDALDGERLAVEPEHAVAVLRLTQQRDDQPPGPPLPRVGRGGSRPVRRPS